AGAFFIVLLVVFTVIAAGRSSLSDWVRLLLLPIHRRELHAVELLGGMAEPWLLVVVPSLLVLALTLAARGPAAFLAVAAGGGLLYLTLGALAVLLSLLVQ